MGIGGIPGPPPGPGPKLLLGGGPLIPGPYEPGPMGPIPEPLGGFILGVIEFIPGGPVKKRVNLSVSEFYRSFMSIFQERVSQTALKIGGKKYASQASIYSNLNCKESVGL